MAIRMQDMIVTINMDIIDMHNYYVNNYIYMFKIMPFYLFLSFFVCMILFYMCMPEPIIVIKEPNINDPLSELYVDDDNVCYKYRREEVQCNSI